MFKWKISFVILLVICFLLMINGNIYSKVEYIGDQYRDPMASVLPKSPKEKPSLDLNIQGIIWGSDDPSAIINGKVMEVGDTVKGAKIIDINKKGILVSFGEENFLVKTGKTKRGK